MMAADAFSACYAARPQDGANAVLDGKVELAIVPWREQTGVEPTLVVLVRPENETVLEIMLGFKLVQAYPGVLRCILNLPFTREAFEGILKRISVEIEHVVELPISLGDHMYSFENLMNS